MRPSPPAVEAIQAYVAALSGGWSGNTDEQILTVANAASVANPASQPTVPKSYTFDDLLAVLSVDSVTKLFASPAFTTIIADINGGDPIAIARWMSVVLKIGVVTQDEAIAMQGVMSQTQPDPSWPAQISWAESTLGRLLDADDLLVARPQ